MVTAVNPLARVKPLLVKSVVDVVDEVLEEVVVGEEGVVVEEVVSEVLGEVGEVVLLSPCISSA